MGIEYSVAVMVEDDPVEDGHKAGHGHQIDPMFEQGGLHGLGKGLPAEAVRPLIHRSLDQHGWNASSLSDLEAAALAVGQHKADRQTHLDHRL